MKNMKWSLVGIAVVGAGLLLGGCNNELKKENEALREENALFKEKTNTCDARVTAAESQLQNLQQANANLQTQLSQKATAPAPQPMPYDASMTGGATPTTRPYKNTSGGGGERFRVSGDVLFASGQATIKNDAKKELDGIVSKIKNNYSGRGIRVEGYTDSDPIRKQKNKWSSNQELSQARADAVRDYLVKRGLSSGNIDTVGRGAANPLGSKAASRRVEIVVVD